MTRRTVTVEIVKTDLKSEMSVVDAICALATKSNHYWRCLGVPESRNGCGFWVAGNGEMDFDYKKSYGIYDINSVCFESEEDMVWDNYEDDIKEVAEKNPQFEFYYHIVSEGVGYLDEVIYAHCSTYSRRENNELSPKQMWNYLCCQINV